MKPFRWYHRRLADHPLVVKSLTSGVVLSTADFLCQWLRSPLAKERPTHDSASGTHGWWNAHQTMWVGVYGTFFVAPFCHVWYQLLERLIPLKGASVVAKLPRVAQRVLLDQAVVAPVFAGGLFLSRGLIAGTFSGLGGVVFIISYTDNGQGGDGDNNDKGESMDTIWGAMRTDFLRVIIAGAIVWPPAQLVNFLFVPLPYRVLFINIVGLGWSTYTSFVASRGYLLRHVLPLPPIVTEPLPLLPYLPNVALERTRAPPPAARKRPDRRRHDFSAADT